MYSVRNFFTPFVLDELAPLFNACTTHKTATPRYNVMESDEAYTVELAAAGMSKNDLQVHLNDEGNLIIKMEHEKPAEEKKSNEHYLRREFTTTDFTETFVLPEDVDKAAISATMADGILTLTLPKVQPVKEKLARQINID